MQIIRGEERVVSKKNGFMRSGICSIGLAFFAVFVLSDSVLAAAEGGRIGHGGDPGCSKPGWTLDTCYGAEWRWYPADSDLIIIDGKNPNESKNWYAVGGTIYNCKKEGGYWRYAMVAFGSNKLYNPITGQETGEWYQPGDQVGLIGIGGNGKEVYNSEFFGGNMNYSGSSSVWDAVHEEYLSWYKPGMLGWNAGSSLSWFCAPQPGTETPVTPVDPLFYGRSLVKNYRDSSKSASTGLVNSYTTGEFSQKITTAEAIIEFSHAVDKYLGEFYPYEFPSSSINWKVEKKFSDDDGVSYTYERVDEGASSGTASFRAGVSYEDCKYDEDCWYYVFTGFKEQRYNSDNAGYDVDFYFMLPNNVPFSPYQDLKGNINVTSHIYRVRFTKNGTYTLCESLTIGDDNKLTKVCAVLEVEVSDFGGGNSTTIREDSTCKQWTPAGAETETKVVTKVKNKRLLNTWGDGPIYAKPGDNVSWVHCYYPGVQTQTNLNATLEHAHFHGGNTAPTYGHAWIGVKSADGNSYPNTNGTVLEKKGSDWGNYFTIYSTNLGGRDPLISFNYTPYQKPRNRTWEDILAVRRVDGDGGGNSKDENGRNMDSNSAYTVQLKQAGEELVQQITSSMPTSVGVMIDACKWACGDRPCADGEKGPCYYYCDHGDTKTFTNTFGGSVSDSASVIVPYNFTTEPTISLEKSIVYAGESFKVEKVEVKVKKRYNGVTKSEYATEVPRGAIVETYAYLSNTNSGNSIENIDGWSICDALPVIDGRSCAELESVTVQGDLNKDGLLSGATVDISGLNHTYNAFDYDVGKYLCVVSAVYPSTSGSYTNTDPENFTGWSVSRPYCAQIAKRPSFQVWGGSLFSAGNIETSTALKTNLYGVSGREYSINNKDKNIFGSWVEQGVVGLGKITGLASGSADAGQKGLFVENSSGYYCKHLVPLSFANYSTRLDDQICGTGMGVEASGKSKIGEGAGSVDRSGLLSYWNPPSDDKKTKEDEVYLNAVSSNSTSLSGRAVKYVDKTDNRDLSLRNTGSINDGTYIVRAKGNIKIVDSISYSDGEFNSLEKIPKVIIYSEKNINIDCRVERVDAILIAKGKVDTCSTNKDGSSTQLRINGVVIADELILGRTYGAGKGVDSGVPAEIINYDSSALLWGSNMADVADTNELTETYLHELAPRY